MVSTQGNIHLYPNYCNDHYISYASKQIAAYEYWTANNLKISIVQKIFSRPCIFDLQADDSNPNFQSVKKYRVHKELLYERFWDILPPIFTEIFVFQNGKFFFPVSFHSF